MTEVGKKRLAAVVALAVAAGALTLLSFGGIEDNLVYYWGPDELLAKQEQARGATIRLGGVVENGSLKWDANRLDLRFALSLVPEPGGAAVPVQAHGAPPQMFREGVGAVVEGHYDGSVFQADRVMVKHSNEYKPPLPGQEPQELYKTLQSAAP